jgi:hypothetical protein
MIYLTFPDGLSEEIKERDVKALKKHFQPERLNKKTYYRNEDCTYPHLEPVIGCDSPNNANI